MQTTFEQDAVMRQAAKQPTLSRVAKPDRFLGKHKTESGKKKARKSSNLRQEQDKWHHMKKSFFFRENTGKNLPRLEVLNSYGESCHPLLPQTRI